MNVYKAERIGQSKEGDRPIRLRLDAELKKEVMRRKKVLSEYDQYNKKVWINNDETSAQRHERYLAREEKRKKAAASENPSGNVGGSQSSVVVVNDRDAVFAASAARA